MQITAGHCRSEFERNITSSENLKILFEQALQGEKPERSYSGIIIGRTAAFNLCSKNGETCFDDALRKLGRQEVYFLSYPRVDCLWAFDTDLKELASIHTEVQEAYPPGNGFRMSASSAYREKLEEALIMVHRTLAPLSRPVALARQVGEDLASHSTADAGGRLRSAAELSPAGRREFFDELARIFGAVPAAGTSAGSPDLNVSGPQVKRP